MIKIKNISKKFANNLVLDDVSANIKKGEIVAVIGPSGSGKSTFLRCINFLEVPDSGSVEIDGVEVNVKTIGKIRAKIGMVFQGFNLFPYMTVIDNTKIWRNKKGEHHREDGPAIEYADGDKHWYKNGKLHREDGPAVEFADGTKQWYKNGKRHREDGPAIEWASGVKEWWLNGQLHREDGPACEYANGTKEWYLNGQFHREDGPACEYANGTKQWYTNDKLHREDGPACEYANGTKFWYLNGGEVTEQEVCCFQNNTRISILMRALWSGDARLEPSTNKIAYKSIRYSVEVNDGLPIIHDELAEKLNQNIV